ncbi:glycosyltransferase [Flavobacteriaceae bacterium 14752]|uniref:glycosyltransferase n=1 Tax=Mesohalobacter salilacus TaxID=2491711 RepID=UPI000F6369DA|nr:glycosyltransferase [Flavobacteriaceae bacterium 14752]
MSTPSPINVLQLIDSLDAGGGERMSVHLANALSSKINFSSLIASRQSGVLENDVFPEVEFFCLNKTHSLDFKALMKLKGFVKQKSINIVHAHSTSFFLATMLKIIYPRIKIIWHDHYGMSDKLNERPKTAIKICSVFFSQIITVNGKLKIWAEKHLYCKNIEYIQNFSLTSQNTNSSQNVQLKGDPKAYKVIHVANLRPQKDHITALNAIKQLVEEGVNLSYHLIGMYDSKSLYYKSIKGFIKKNNLSKSVYIYGSQTDISGLLKQSNVGLLSSVSEGLPVSLIEYAQAKLPIVVTDVGQCKDVVGNLATVIEPKNNKALAQAIKYNLNHDNEANKNALKLYNKITSEFDPEKIIQQIIGIYTTVREN